MGKIGYLVYGVKWGKTRPRDFVPRIPKRYLLFTARDVYDLIGERSFGICCVARRSRAARGEYVGWSSLLRRFNDMKRRASPGSRPDALHLAPIESDILGRHHALVSHCCELKYDDGEPRQPGWWTVKTMGSAWVVEVKDPDSCCRLVVVQQTLDEAFTLAALLLDSEEAPWEPDPWLSAQRAKKKK